MRTLGVAVVVGAGRLGCRWLLLLLVVVGLIRVLGLIWTGIVVLLGVRAGWVGRRRTLRLHLREKRSVFMRSVDEQYHIAYIFVDHLVAKNECSSLIT